MVPTRWLSLLIGGLLAGILSLHGCAGNRYEQKAETIKEYVNSFYENLEARKVEEAVYANQQIETVALESEAYLLRRVGQMSHAERTREWKVIKSARETAAENWLSLARYFLQVGEYERARLTYKRLIESYSDPAYETYVTRATTGLRDVDLFLSSGGTSQ